MKLTQSQIELIWVLVVMALFSGVIGFIYANYHQDKEDCDSKHGELVREVNGGWACVKELK